MKRARWVSLCTTLAVAFAGCALPGKPATSSKPAVIRHALPTAKVSAETTLVIDVAADPVESPPVNLTPGTAVIIFDEEPPKPAAAAAPTSKPAFLPVAPPTRQEEPKRDEQKPSAVPAKKAPVKKTDPPKSVPSLLPSNEKEFRHPDEKPSAPPVTDGSVKKTEPPKSIPSLLPPNEGTPAKRVAKSKERPPAEPVNKAAATTAETEPAAGDVWSNLSKSMEKKGIAVTEQGKAVKRQPPPTPAREVQPVSAAREDDVYQPVNMTDQGDDADIQQTGCTNCGERRGLLDPHGGKAWQGDNPCDCGNGCYPGRKKCHPIHADTCVGRAFAALYECICCKDPCYEPEWLPIADSAFFVDCARPQTQTRIRYDAGLNLRLPDRAEYFWARSDGRGQGPRPKATSLYVGETAVDYNDLRMFTEVGTGNIGIMVDLPYRSIDADESPDASGWTDMMVGTKTLLCDCELLQISFLFKTYIPMGSATKGIGTGHLSLEPSLVLTVKLGKDTYFQGQLAEWIPIGGDPDYSGAILHYHKSINHVLARLHPDVPLIGTLEFNGWSFQDGLYTDPFRGGGQRASGDGYFSVGGGLRLFICDKIDIGFGCAFAIDDPNFAEQRYIFDFRWRY